MTTELITQDDMRITSDIARMFHQSGMFKNVQSEAQAFVKIMLGREFGLGPAESMRSVYVVNGKPSFEAAWIAGKIQGSGRYRYKIVEHTDEVCTIRFYELAPDRQWEPLADSTFTMSDARKADIMGNPNYRKYPRNMLFARALTNGARWHTPEVFNGAVYTPDELRAGEGPEHVDVGVLPTIEEIRRPAIEAAPSAPTEAQIQADLERLGLRNRDASEAAEATAHGPNPWLHVLEGVEHDGFTTPSAGKRICEVATDLLRKVKPSSKYFTAADKAAIAEALSDPSRREEALASLEQTRNVEQLAFEDDAIPVYSEDRR